jgi:hypothetical protein
MEPRYYIGLDVHKRKISYCVKDGGDSRLTSDGVASTCRMHRVYRDLAVRTLPPVQRGEKASCRQEPQNVTRSRPARYWPR